MVLKINEFSDDIISEEMMTEMGEYIKFIAEKLENTGKEKRKKIIVP